MATAYVRHKSGLIRTSHIQDIAYDAAFGGRINVLAAGVEVEVVEMAAIDATQDQKRATSERVPWLAESLAIAIDLAEATARIKETTRIVSFDKSEGRWVIDDARGEMLLER